MPQMVSCCLLASCATNMAAFKTSRMSVTRRSGAPKSPGLRWLPACCMLLRGGPVTTCSLCRCLADSAACLAAHPAFLLTALLPLAQGAAPAADRHATVPVPAAQCLARCRLQSRPRHSSESRKPWSRTRRQARRDFPAGDHSGFICWRARLASLAVKVRNLQVEEMDKIQYDMTASAAACWVLSNYFYPGYLGTPDSGQQQRF